jgi:hypothetical protein
VTRQAVTEVATAVPNWSLGDVIPLGHRALRVIAKRDGDVVEDELSSNRAQVSLADCI